MNLSIFLLAAIFVLSLSADALTLKDKCFRKVTPCCFKFARCGAVQKDIPSGWKCDFKKCKTVCTKSCSKPVCTDVKKTIPSRTCVPAYKKVCTKAYYLVGKETCKQEADGESCKTTNTYKMEKVCGKPVCVKKCPRACVAFKATCSKVKKVSYKKWCAKETCEKEVVEGSAVKPADQVDTKEDFLSESKPVRKIIGKYK